MASKKKKTKNKTSNKDLKSIRLGDGLNKEYMIGVSIIKNDLDEYEVCIGREEYKDTDFHRIIVQLGLRYLRENGYLKNKNKKKSKI